MTKQIFIVEDDGKLIEEAQRILDMDYEPLISFTGRNLTRDNKLVGASLDFVLRYALIQLDLPKAMQIDYWNSLNITKDDCVVLDLHYGNYMDPNTKTVQRIPFNGRKVLLELAMNKANRIGVKDLERVLIATSLPLEVNPEHVHPEIALVSGFDVYGLEKGKDKTDKIIGYGKSLLERLDAIYEPLLLPEEQRITPLNLGWRSDNDVKNYNLTRRK